MERYEAAFYGKYRGPWSSAAVVALNDEAIQVLGYYRDTVFKGQPRVVSGSHPRHAADFLSDSRGVGVYNPICKEMVQDMIALCDGLLDGSVVPVQHDWNERLGRYSTKAQLGRAGMVLFPEQIR